MSVAVKICGLTDVASVVAAVEGGAAYLGFVFCEESKRRIDAATAASLIKAVSSGAVPVGLFVNPSDDELSAVLNIAPLQALQLHGNESPARVEQVKKATGLSVIKAIGIAAPQDVERVRTYEAVADLLLLDAKAAPGRPLGGNGVAFDWSLIKNAGFSKPWLLAGGLSIDNIEAAVQKTGAKILDVSSGVENAAGQKTPEKISEFLAKARGIETCY